MPDVDFITLSREPTVTPLADSIDLVMNGLGKPTITVVDGTSHDLFTGYNAGAAKTKNDLLVFVHDDVQFLGNRLTMAPALALLERDDVGFIGVAGSGLLPADGTWWGFRGEKENLPACRGMVAHPTDENDFGVQFNTWPFGPGAGFGRVLVLDGVLLMCHRRTFDRLGGFDAAMYRGFHYYDIDITFRASMQHLSNLVAPIPLLHRSGGSLGPAWETNRQAFLRKFGRFLPAGVR